MKRLSFIVLPLLIGTQAYGMMRGGIPHPEEEPSSATPAAAVAAPAAAASAAPEIQDLSEEQFKQQFLSDFEGQDALVTQSPTQALSYFRGLQPSTAHENLLTQLLGMRFEDSRVLQERTFFEAAKAQLFTGDASPLTYADLYKKYIRPLRGYHALWVASNWDPTKLGTVFTENLEQVTELTLVSKYIAFINDDLFRIFIGLQQLLLSDNGLTTPSDLSHNPRLQSLDLRWNSLRTPPNISHNPRLEQLYLANSQLTAPPDVSQNPQLCYLSLNNNNITAVPDLSQNPQLWYLSLNNNNITAVPDLSYNLLLQELWLNDNQLTTFPTLTAESVPHLIVLDLSNNPLLPEGIDGQWGRRELRARFGDRVDLDDPTTAPPMNPGTKKEDIYTALANTFPHINFKMFEGLIPPQVPGITFDSNAMLKALDHMWARLNLTHQDAPNFVGYEAASNDFASEGLGGNLPSDPGVRNRFLMERYVKPRLYGFLKTLWGIALEEGENGGWQINQAQRDELRHALSYILGRFGQGNDLQTPKKLLASEDVTPMEGDDETASASAARALPSDVAVADDIVPPLFYMLTNALFHCPTGQVEGINAMIYSLLSTGADQGNLERRILRMLALEKLHWFPRAVLTKGGADNTQNTHLISHYRQVLRERMNLPSTVQTYQERMGIMGHDPFGGNPWNVVETFYGLVTPYRMADWILRHTENHESLALRLYQTDIENALAALQPSPNFTERQLKEFARKNMKIPTQKTLDADMMGRLKEKGIDPTNQTALKTALQTVKAQIEQDRMHRFFNVGDMVAYFKDKGIIPAPHPQDVEEARADVAAAAATDASAEAALADSGAARAGAASATSADAATHADKGKTEPSSWWQGLFTNDPEDPYAEPPALLTQQGALKILERLGMIVPTPQ